MSNSNLIELGYEKKELIYENKLSKSSDISDFTIEGEGITEFKNGCLQLRSALDPSYDQKSNIVMWCKKDFPDKIIIEWDFKPIQEPGLCILFFSTKGINGEDIFDENLQVRTGPYDQYHHGDINCYHLAYFRRRYESERTFHVCNLRKSYGAHLVTQGADPMASVPDVLAPYHVSAVKYEGHIIFYIDNLKVFEWIDDGKTYGPILGAGKIGFRQMAPLIGEYSNFKIHTLIKK